ncbi:hypothetical protein HOLleu_19994 [Holothuria leucospilota]|uniref:Uncharacterized protein n=1 Tax=Holothuria leucospilota TaxID=206669 RepID=A0A9Q1H865_HOLLE|nr:hypothetical protein HOLleu_19994 [Holothuria leucospilota]
MTAYFGRKELSLKHLTKMVVLYCIYLLMSVSLASGRAKVSLKLIRYENPSHLEMTGRYRYCTWLDVYFSPVGVCNNRFSLCIDEIGRSDTMDYCDFLKMDYFYSANKDNFFFPSAFGIYGENPLEFEVPNYMGGFQVKIDIWDREIFHVNDEGHIDFYKQDIYSRPSFTNPSYYTLYGRGHSITKIAVKVSCASDYYDEKCSTYCATNGTDLERNYKCDPLTGARVQESVPNKVWTCTPRLWLLIGVSTGFVFGLFLTLYSCKAHATKHLEDIEANRRY